MTLTIDNFDTQLTKELIKKGRTYADNKAVLYVEADENGVWKAEVDGTETYSVEIQLKDRLIADVFCDCPVESSYCKHVVATLFMIRAELAKPKAKSAKRTAKKLTLEELVQKVKLDEWRRFVLDYAATDKTFATRLQLHFADKDDRIDIGKQYTELIKKAVRTNSDRGFVDYRGASRLARQIEPLLADGEQFLAKQNYRDAIIVGRVVMAEMMDVVKQSDDSSGNISGTVSYAIRLLEQVALADELAPPLRQQLYDFAADALLSKNYADYGDFDYELLNVAAETARRLPQPERFITLTDKLITLYRGQYSNYARDSFRTRQITFLTEIGRTAEADRLTEASLDVTEVRRSVVEKAIGSGDFDRAILLIKEAITKAEVDKLPGLVNQWEELLLQIARTQKDVTMVRRLTKKFAFDRRFNQTYYQQWKQTFSADEWPAEYDALVNGIRREEDEQNASPKKGMWYNYENALFMRLSPIYTEEKRWDDLRDLFLKAPTLEKLQQVHPYLAKTHPADLLPLYLTIIRQIAKTVSSRPEYKRVADLIQLVRTDIADSHAVTTALIYELKATFLNRPAMQDELSKIK